MNESINEWNFWDGDNRRSSSAPRQTRLIDVADKMRREDMLTRKERYKNDPEYYEHIKRLEDELRRTDDPQHAEYLERRISKLRSLSEGVKPSRALNEMSIESFNTRVAKDFVAMALQYVNDEPDTVVDGEFNYGEYDSWVKAYPELADLCMAGDNNVSDAADELLDALFNFIRVAQMNTITSTHRREFKENDVEVVEEGVDTGQYMSAEERKEMYRLNRKDREEEIYAQIKRLRRKILNGVTPEEEDMYREEIDRLKSLL